MERLIQVLVVDDSAFMRKMISDMLNRNPRINVVGTARNGQDALKKRNKLRPDVITLDVEMPIMDGLETLKRLMDDDPCSVVMISSTTKEGAENTLLAMEYGAVDFIAKPSGAISLDIAKVEKEIAWKVIQAANANVSRSAPKPIMKKPMRSQLNHQKKIIAIGTSTGGPRALKDVLTNLPAAICAPILIVQHMPATFTRSLAERLNSLSAIKVKEAEHGDVLEDGTAYIAPGGYHMTVRKVGSSLFIETNEEEPIRGHRPAVDKLYESLASIKGIHTIAAIMTGMGADGTDGLIRLKKHGSCYAIAEAKESCVVFGMPKAAIKTKLVDEVSHVNDIAERLVHACKE
ncbi:chemotaxis response regulator protein-glutamate methylesterase [bacterium LRH843]|nr:chemotaxis response regulator protein-glutamate methylesterase [bacterium LRH843]